MALGAFADHLTEDWFRKTSRSLRSTPDRLMDRAIMMFLEHS
jgi:hypothetical protein